VVKKAYEKSIHGSAKLKIWNRRSRLAYRYGISESEYERRNTEQSGLCAICSKPPSGGIRTTRLFIDHDHATGRIRGLICIKCNSALAQFGDTIEGLMNAVAYLRGDVKGIDRSTFANIKE
jgi:hypothetical protein